MEDGFSQIRLGEQRVDAPDPDDARLRFIGRIHTPFAQRADCPRQGAQDGPECRVELFAPWVAALDGIEQHEQLDLLYWLDRARRDLVRQTPRRGGSARGTFSLRSPLRPNPIGLSRVRLIRREGDTLVVAGLDCLDGTPLLDVKPELRRAAALR